MEQHANLDYKSITEAAIRYQQEINELSKKMTAASHELKILERALEASVTIKMSEIIRRLPHGDSPFFILDASTTTEVKRALFTADIDIIQDSAVAVKPYLLSSYTDRLTGLSIYEVNNESRHPQSLIDRVMARFFTSPCSGYGSFPHDLDIQQLVIIDRVGKSRTVPMKNVIQGRISRLILSDRLATSILSAKSFNNLNT